MNTAMMSHKNSAYNVVISLNNAGVSLIQRRLYNEAVETLKDAIRLMRFSFFSGESSMPMADDFDRALHAAWQRTSIKHAEEQDGVNLVVITDHDNPYTVYDTIDQHPEFLCCVNIDPVECYCDKDLERLEIESSLLLYNYGIAHRCAARSTTIDWDDCTRCNILNTAFQIFELAQSVAVKLLPASDLIESSSSILLVALLVTANLLQMSLHSVELSWQYSDDLEDLLATISEQEMLHPQEDVAAAAAA